LIRDSVHGNATQHRGFVNLHQFFTEIPICMVIILVCGIKTQAAVNHQKEQHMNQENASRSPMELPPIDLKAPADFQTATFGLG
jgi:hypothetical protein